MRYAKPEIVIAGSAVTSIQGGGKPLGSIVDAGDVRKHQTPNAYEADE